MISLNDIWKLLAGLGLFLFGMSQLEEGIRQLSGRTFKLFLKKRTGNKLSAILSGTLVTGILQSSSVVSFMVLAFLGAGVIPMRNALAIMLGSNLGTTLDSWMVATLGFKVGMERFALPVIAIAAGGVIFFRNRHKLYNMFLLLFGFGLLFFGLDFMKVAMEATVENFDFTPYLGYSRLVFVLLGIVLTVLIQSSSATMVVTLSALSAGAFPLETAVSIIIGAELGTVVKIIVSSIGGVAAKKRVALGNFLFNLIVTVIAFVFMHPILYFISHVLGLTDPLLVLVCFQTVINLGGIILLFPFLNLFSTFLERRFKAPEKAATHFIPGLKQATGEESVDALEKETELLLHRVIDLNLGAFQIQDKVGEGEKELHNIIQNKNKVLRTYEERYNDVKQAGGEILAFYPKWGEERSGKATFERMHQIVASVRNAMYSAKGIKDIHQDRKELRDSADDLKYGQYLILQQQLRYFYETLDNILTTTHKSEVYEALVSLTNSLRDEYAVRVKSISRISGRDVLPESDISTLLNVNREMYSSCKAMIFAVKDFLLDPQQAEAFDNIPVRV